MVTHNSLNQKSDTFIVTDDSGNTITNTTATGVAVTPTSGQYGVAVTNNGNAFNGMSITNTTSGTAGAVGVSLTGNGGNAATIGLFSPGYTTNTNLTGKMATTAPGIVENLSVGTNSWQVYKNDILRAQIADDAVSFFVEMNVNGTVSGRPSIRNQYDDSGAAAGPSLELYRNSSSPTSNDLIGYIDYTGQNSTPAKVSYVTSTAQIDTATAAAEDSSWRLATRQAGSLVNQIIALKTGCQIRGNNTNTAAPAGYIGEVLTASLASGSALTLTTGTDTNITSISLTAGNWQIAGTVIFAGSLTGTAVLTGCSGTSATIGADGNYSQLPSVPTASSNLALATPSIYVSLSTTTTYYLIGRAVFTAGTCTAWGKINAIRIG